MVKNYLSDRKQRVILREIASDWPKILAGVPKGSILLIFINAIVNDKGYCIRLFADGINLSIIVDDPISSSERLG